MDCLLWKPCRWGQIFYLLSRYHMMFLSQKGSRRVCCIFFQIFLVQCRLRNCFALGTRNWWGEQGCGKNLQDILHKIIIFLSIRWCIFISVNNKYFHYFLTTKCELNFNVLFILWVCSFGWNQLFSRGGPRPQLYSFNCSIDGKIIRQGIWIDYFRLATKKHQFFRSD